MSDKRVSQLLDMCIGHIIRNRTLKALLIAQYLRGQFGMSLAFNQATERHCASVCSVCQFRRNLLHG